MRAVVCTRYGPPEVLTVAEVARPIPKGRDICIRVVATSATSSDCIVRSGKVDPRLWVLMRLVIGLRGPRKTLGMVFAGEVASIGAEVTRFKVGDEVFGFDRFGFGAYAEYKCLPETGLVAPKPANLDYEEAAAIPYGGLLALHYLTAGGIAAGQRVLVYGASGAVGSSAVQLARHFRARVTGVCSTANLAWVRQLGAETVVDYTRVDALATGETYDLIFDAVPAVHRTVELHAEAALAPNGRYVSVTRGSPKFDRDQLVLLAQLTEAGELQPVVDRRYRLEEIVEAHRYVDTGRKKGNVVVRVSGDRDDRQARDAETANSSR